MKTFKRGLVVGKFAPLHRGHMHVIDTALANCDEVLVITYSNPPLGFSPHWKKIWFKKLYPQVRLLAPEGVYSPNNNDSEYTHREHCVTLLRNAGYVPDCIFSSESYGAPFAEHLSRAFGVAIGHFMVDEARSTVPISAIKLRDNPAMWPEYVHEVVRNNRTKRVVILGGESAGKTSLARSLSARMGWPWVQEYGREFCELIGGVANLVEKDLTTIGKQQIVDEEVVLGFTAAPWLICDTSPLTTRFYSEKLFGRTSPELMAASERHYDAYIILGMAHGWHQDGDRMSPEFSAEQLEWYFHNVQRRGAILTYIPGGTVAERVETVERLLE